MSRPKLLHISLGSHNQGMWRAFNKEFETVHFDWTTFQSNPLFINQEVRRLFDQFKPDVVFMQLQIGGIISIPTAKYMSKSSITINWTGDVRHPIPEWYAELGRNIDITLFSNMTDVNTFNQMGINADYLQVGFDEKIFTPSGSKNKYPNIIFLGSNYDRVSSFPLTQLRLQMVQRLRSRYGVNFMAYGYHWKGVGCGEHFLHQPQEAEAYRSCKIAINLSHFDYSRYSSDRMLRMMGSGGFCLSHHFKDIEEDYVVDKHVATWNGVDSLISKIDYYLDNPKEREKIRKAGCEFVRDNYTWDKVMIELKKVLGL